MIVSFLLKSIFSSGLLSAYYWFVLRNKRFHHYNRLYLLLALVTSLVIPFLNFRLYSFEESVPVNLNSFSHQIFSNSAIQPHSLMIWEPLLYTSIISISLIMLLVLLSQILWMYKIKKSNTITRMDGFNFIETELKQAPFCFLNNLFWRRSISMLDDNGKKIFAHELTHIRDGHTYDKLFSRIMLCFFWMNPFYWFIQKELNMIHEFIADSKSIRDGDAESFAMMLLYSHNESRYLNPSHSFFHSSIKRRLLMITTSKNTRLTYLRRVLALPITVLIFMAFSFTIGKAQRDQRRTAGSVKIDKVFVIQDTVKNNGHDTTIIASVKFLKKDGTTDSLTVPVTYSVSVPNPVKVNVSRKNITVRTNVNFVKKDGTTGSIIVPVTYSVNVTDTDRKNLPK